MDEEILFSSMLSAVDTELRECINLFFAKETDDFREIIYYQMGWDSESSTGSTGKRIRPVILLAACHALGLDWQQAVPAAAAVELVHNFSLVHDDIQDHSVTRRGKPTIWVKWGEAQAINTGDALLTVANLEVQRLKSEPKIILQSLNCLTSATLQLIKGQYLDLAFENAENVPLSSYWEMVNGKTGALFGACFALAAIIAGETQAKINKLEAFGSQLGVAFQVQDDYLGIFGDDEVTGKSVISDLYERKKSFPIIYGLNNVPEFRKIWLTQTNFSSSDISRLKEILIENNVNYISQAQAQQLFTKIETDFVSIFGENERNLLLDSMIKKLFDRSM